MSVEYWVLLVVYVTVEGLGWMNVVSFWQYLRQQKQAERSSRIPSASPKMTRVISGSFSEKLQAYVQSKVETPEGIRWFALVSLLTSLVYLSLSGWTFAARADKQQVHWVDEWPFFYYTIGVVFLAISFFFLLCLSLFRLRLIFHMTIMEVPVRRLRTYGVAIVIHGLVELATPVAPLTARWVLWVIYDVMLCLIVGALCYDFTSRLMLMVQKITDPSDKNSRNGSSEKDHTDHELRLFGVAAKMTVLSIVLMIASLLWSTGPFIWLLTKDSENRSVIEVSHITEGTFHFGIFATSMAYIYLSFSAADPIYYRMCSHTCHRIVMDCLIHKSDQAMLAESMRNAANSRSIGAVEIEA